MSASTGLANREKTRVLMQIRRVFFIMFVV